ncbi:MAG: glutamate-5-semialdehyde dehydrogenase, partial [Acidimicrobiales bacterium]
MSTTTPPELVELGTAARLASRALARASSAVRNEAILFAADFIDQESDRILATNDDDVARLTGSGADATSLDRLRLDRGRIQGMAAGLRQVAALNDPVGEVVDGWVRPNGLRISRVRVPLGVIGIIYENRPNVTSDAAGLCLKSGNAVLLRGSSSALGTNLVIASLLRQGLEKAGLPAGAVGLVEDTSHDSAVAFMRLDGAIDCLIPRGGPSLIEAIREHATVPFVLDGEGNCHVYVDAAADLSMATAVVVNAKTSRPGVCNAMETLLVHRDVAGAFLPQVARALAGVELL